MKYEEWVVLEINERILIKFFLDDLVLFNVSKENIVAIL
jgi:hypothetical protein